MRTAKGAGLVMLLAGCVGPGASPPPSPTTAPAQPASASPSERAPTPHATGNPAPEPSVEGVHFAASEADLRSGQFVTAVNLLAQRELWIVVDVVAIQEPSSLRVVFSNPRGEPLYENRTFHSLNPQGKTVPMPGGLAAALVLPAHRRAALVQLEQSVPIGGSVFERYPAQGAWTVQAFVDQRPPLTATLDASYHR